MTRRAFTLIELSVAIVVLALLSALVAPRLIALRTGQEARGIKFAVRDLAREARLRAVQGGGTVILRVEGNGERLQMLSAGGPDGDSEETALRSVILPSSVELPTLRRGQTDSGEAEWEMRFYADGRSDGGGIEIEHDGSLDSVVVGENGSVRLQEGPLPEAIPDSWPAGGNEQRL